MPRVIITERTARITFTGKGTKTQGLKLHLDVKNALLDYLKVREKIRRDSDYLFLSERKTKFSRSEIWKIINKYSAR